MKKWLEYSNDRMDLFLQTYFVEEAEHANNRGNVFDAPVYAVLEDKYSFVYLVARFEDFCAEPMFLGFERPKKVSAFFTSETLTYSKRVKVSENDEDYEECRNKGWKTRVKQFTKPNPAYCGDDRSRFMSSYERCAYPYVSGDQFVIISDTKIIASFDGKIRNFENLEESTIDRDFSVCYEGSFDIRRLKEPKTVWEIISGRKEKFNPDADWFITDEGKKKEFIRFTQFDVDRIFNVLPGDKRKNTVAYLPIARPDIIGMNEFMRIMLAAYKENKGGDAIRWTDDLELRLRSGDVWYPGRPSRRYARLLKASKRCIELFYNPPVKLRPDSGIRQEVRKAKWESWYRPIRTPEEIQKMKDDEEAERLEEQRKAEALKREEEARIEEQRKAESLKREEEARLEEQRRAETLKLSPAEQKRRTLSLIASARKNKSLIPQISAKSMERIISTAQFRYEEILRYRFEHPEWIRRNIVNKLIRTIRICARQTLFALRRMGLIYLPESVFKAAERERYRSERDEFKNHQEDYMRYNGYYFPIDEVIKRNGLELKYEEQVRAAMDGESKKKRNMSFVIESSKNLEEHLRQCAVPLAELRPITDFIWGLNKNWWYLLLDRYAQLESDDMIDFMEDQLYRHLFENCKLDLHPEYYVAPDSSIISEWREYVSDNLWADATKSMPRVMFDFLNSKGLVEELVEDFVGDYRTFYKGFLSGIEKNIEDLDDYFSRALGLELAGDYDIKCWRI
ncbi:MAG: hypothetical protein MJ234_04810 [bacterium]|nr:hypothetical protein [bacterium]